MIRVANGAGFFGDDLDAPRRLLQDPDVDFEFLTLEYLAELTMSILAQQRAKNPSRGYAGDFLRVLESIESELLEQEHVRIVTNAGGLNPLQCARQAATKLAQLEPSTKMAIVTGDDLLPIYDDLRAEGIEFEHADTGQPFHELQISPLTMNAYLGAPAISSALEDGARFVVTGRIADAALTVGPAAFHHKWSWDDWDRLAGASVAGHLIECGAQVTGGYTTSWRDSEFCPMPYPVASISHDGDCTIMPAGGDGGNVNRRTVVEQLIYEVGDPSGYLTPDVSVDFTEVEVEEIDERKVAVSGARGNPAPDHLKVTLTYPNGFMTSAQMLVYGDDAIEKAKEVAEIVWRRLAESGHSCERTNAELLGTGQGVPGGEDSLACEVVLRLSVQDRNEANVRRFSQSIAPLITNGPAGLAGYAAARAAPRPVFAYWPCFVPADRVESAVISKTLAEWASEV